MDDETAALVAKLQAATAGLLWMSEIDAPLQVIHWPSSVLELTPEQLLKLTNQPPTTPVKQVAVDDLFAGATEDQDWFEDEERAIAQRYRELLALLKQSLDNLQGYRVGEVNIDLYIVGQTNTKDWVGLTTKAVET